MTNILEYYLSGGSVRIGKKELALELLRKDSILRVLLGFEADNPASLPSPVNMAEQGDEVIIGFNFREKRRINDDPTPMLNILKKRYGKKIGGILHFQCFYETFEWTYYYDVNLDAENVTMVQVG